MKHYIIPIFVSHLGCPHTCVFCNQSRITAVAKEDIRMIDGEAVLTIADTFLKTIPNTERVVELSFFGGTFTAIAPSHQINLLTAAKKLKDAGLIQHIRCSTRPDFIDEMILDRCQAYGMDIIELGVQSLDRAVLKASGRGHDDQSVLRASQLIRDYGMTLGHQIMPGLPGADPASDLATARASIAMKPDQVRIYPTLVVKDTPLAEMYQRGDYKPYSLDEAVTLSGEIMTLYEAADIQIIRVGLQASQEIAPGADLLAGPYHPAFRELTLSKRLNARIKHTLDEARQEAGPAELWINPKDLSVLYADKKHYFKPHQNRLTVTQSEAVARGQLLIRREGDLDRTLCI